MPRAHQEQYDYSVNMSVEEVEDILKFMKENGTDLVGLHFSRGGILGSLHISGTGRNWDDIENHIDITPYHRA